MLQEGAPGQFGHLVRYWLATVGAMRPSTMTHTQTVATSGTVSYATLLGAAPGGPTSVAAAAVRAQLLAGAPGAGDPPNLGALVDDALVKARESVRGRAWSGAFVSHCIRRAAISLGLESDGTGIHRGRDVLLLADDRHRDYLVEALRRTSGPGRQDGSYHAFAPASRSVQVGDVIVQDRHASDIASVWGFAAIPQMPRRRLHSDVVLHVAPGDHAVTVGGNLRGSVRLRRYPLDANDHLVVVREQLYTQEPTAGLLPGLPSVSAAAGLHVRSTARIFALLSPMPSCIIVPSPLFGGP